MIEIRNCSKAFGEIHAIDHVLMEIGERQIFGLVGTNGAGKSTLLRMAAGVISRTKEKSWWIRNRSMRMKR